MFVCRPYKKSKVVKCFIYFNWSPVSLKNKLKNEWRKTKRVHTKWDTKHKQKQKQKIIQYMNEKQTSELKKTEPNKLLTSCCLPFVACYFWHFVDFIVTRIIIYFVLFLFFWGVFIRILCHLLRHRVVPVNIPFFIHIFNVRIVFQCTGFLSNWNDNVWWFSFLCPCYFGTFFLTIFYLSNDNPNVLSIHNGLQ